MDWFELDFFKNKLQQILDKIAVDESTGKTVLPKIDDMFNAFIYCKYIDTKVVIIGQDPYPTPGHAHGLAFSVTETTPLPKSLINIYKEMESDLSGKPRNGNLVHWAYQGVLLLNTSLSVIQGIPNSHKDIGWNDLIMETLTVLNEKEFLVYLLWGKNAQAFEPFINKKHAVVKSAHPSPLSAHNGFFGSKPFSRVNNLLEVHGLDGIDWIGG